jgi:hypothetical protein
MLKQLPGGMIHTPPRSRSQLPREILDGAVKIRMCVAALYQIDQVFPQSLVVLHLFVPFRILIKTFIV